MNFSRPTFLTQAVLWFGVMGAPLAWVAFHLVGVGSSDTACAPAGVRWGIDSVTWTMASTAACGAIAVASILTSAFVVLRTRDVEKDDPPPLGRVHFMAVIGLTVGILFLFIILMAGIGGSVLPRCDQS